jgi:hypothetical protein
MERELHAVCTGFLVHKAELEKNQHLRASPVEKYLKLINPHGG